MKQILIKTKLLSSYNFDIRLQDFFINSVKSIKTQRSHLEKLWDNNLLSICKIIDTPPASSNTAEKASKEYNENLDYIEYLKNRKAEFQRKRNNSLILTRMSTISSFPTSENVVMDTRFEKILDVM